MKKMLGLLLYAGLMFGVTAGLGTYMLKKSSSQGSGTADADTGELAAHDGHGLPERVGDDQGTVDHGAVASHGT